MYYNISNIVPDWEKPDFEDTFGIGDEEMGPAYGLAQDGREDVALAYLMIRFDFDKERAQDALDWFGY